MARKRKSDVAEPEPPPVETLDEPAPAEPVWHPVPDEVVQVEEPGPAETSPPEPVCNVHESLRHLLVPMADLLPDPANANVHDEASILGIMSSLEIFGQDQPLVVQKQANGVQVVRKGNGRYEAAKRLGWSHVAAAVVEESDTRATARAIADNQTARLSRWDEKQVVQLLRAVGEDDGDLTPQSLGFSEADLARLEAVADGFQPALTPAAAAGDVTGDDVDKAADGLDGKFDGEQKLLPVICPQCSNEFYVNPDPPK